MVRFAGIVALALLVAALWALYGLAGDYRVFGGVSTANAMLWVAWLATALLLVFTIGRLIVGVGFTFLDREATGLQRGIIYAVITFLVVSVILGGLGMNVTAILTTSVLATAVVGLAMQPTLGGLIAGSALQLDRVLNVGDVILLGGERIEVVSLTWRSVVGRKHGGTTVVIPNARVADTQIDIIRADQPARVEFTVPCSVSVPPHRVSEGLGEAIYDLPHVDPAHAVEIAPTDFQVGYGYTNYRVEYWVRRNQHVGPTRSAFLSRVWYVFQREDILWRDMPQGAGPDHPPRLPATAQLKGARLDRLADQVPGSTAALGAGLAGELLRRAIAETGPVLAYTDGELILLPRRVRPFALFLLLDGRLREAAAARHDASLAGLGSTVHSGRRMAVERIASHLARRIGPYAEHAVREAAALDPDPVAVGAAVAHEIEDAEERASFLHGLQLDADETHKPGFVFGLQGGAYNRVSSPALRAVGRAIIVPIALETAPRKGEAAQPTAAKG
jgi:small-conductance mechanosensitive channel